MEQAETADQSLARLLETAERLVEAVEKRGVAEPGSPVRVNVDNRVDNRRTERAAWVCGIACAVCFTIVITQAFQIHSLQRANEAMQAKYDRMQDYLNFIYQQAPYLRKPEPSK